MSLDKFNTSPIIANSRALGQFQIFSNIETGE